MLVRRARPARPARSALPCSAARTCARYGAGTQTATSHADVRQAATSARSSASLAARLPFIFQLPTTSLRRMSSRHRRASPRSARACRCAGSIPSARAPCAASAGRERLWITGLICAGFEQRPDLLLAATAAIAALNATGRGRSVEPVIVSRRRSTRPASNSLLVPPCTAMMTRRPSSARHFDLARRRSRRRPCRGSTSTPSPPVMRLHLGDEVLRLVVDGVVGAERRRRPRTCRRCRPWRSPSRPAPWPSGSP